MDWDGLPEEFCSTELFAVEINFALFFSSSIRNVRMHLLNKHALCRDNDDNNNSKH